MNNELISDIGEKELIKILLDKRDKRLKSDDYILKSSYHDDAALVLNNSKYTVMSTDMLLQHSHFPVKMTAYQMGAKCVTANVSDILAMNSVPDSILISMGLPPNMTLEEYDDLTDGILDKCDEYEIKLIGGDINESDEIILCGTSVGVADENVKLQRGVCTGDLIAVTGKLGTPAAGFDLLNSDNASENYYDIINTLLYPTLPLEEAKILRKYPLLTTSITDITDGLAVELGHLHDKNENLGFEIDYDKIPYDEAIKDVALKFNKKLSDYLLHFGEEFELLLTFNEEEYLKHEKELSSFSIIGKANDSGKITLIADNTVKNIPVKGYEHLKD